MSAAPRHAPGPKPEDPLELPLRKRRRGRAPAPSRRLGELPEPSSINALLREHHRTRLYVPPLHWTATHLQLLECQFTRLPSGTSEAPDTAGVPIADAQDRPVPEVAAQALDDAIIEAMTHIRCNPSTEVKIAAVQYLLDAYGFRRVSSDLPFRFNRRAATTLRTQGVFSRPSTPLTPCLAYLDLKTVASRRDRSVRLSATTRRMNLPVVRLRRKHQRRIRPQQEEEDPYITAVLIALAQARLAGEGAANRSGTTMEVRLFALSTDSRAFYFYSARVPLAFLHRLDRPSRHFPGGGFRVQYHRVSLTSPEKVRGIGSALAAICGR